MSTAGPFASIPDSDDDYAGHEMTEPRYETAHELARRIGHTDTVVCVPCGVFVMDKAAHTRFHAELSGSTWSLAPGVLTVGDASRDARPGGWGP